MQKVILIEDDIGFCPQIAFLKDQIARLVGAGPEFPFGSCAFRIHRLACLSGMTSRQTGNGA